jgi:hypothetical protein
VLVTLTAALWRKLSTQSSSQDGVDVLEGQILFELSPIKWDSVFLETEFSATFATQEQVSKTDAQLLVNF